MRCYRGKKFKDLPLEAEPLPCTCYMYTVYTCPAGGKVVVGPMNLVLSSEQQSRSILLGPLPHRSSH